MKIRNLFITFFLIASVLNSNKLFSQKTHLITLFVNTSNIEKGVNKNSNFGQNSKITNEEFTVDVKIGDTVKWIGKSTSSSKDFVEILSINYQGGARVFSKNVLKGKKGIISAKVTKGKPGEYQKYNIKFRVKRNGEKKSKLFKIDPKIRIRA